MVTRKVYTPGSQPPDKHGKAKGGLGLSPGRGRKGNYRHKYTPEMIRQAFQLVIDKTMTLNAAAKKYGIPKTTLFDRMKFRTEKVGRPTVLTEDEETIIFCGAAACTDWMRFPAEHQRPQAPHQSLPGWHWQNYQE